MGWSRSRSGRGGAALGGARVRGNPRASGECNGPVEPDQPPETNLDRERYVAAPNFEEYLAGVQKNRDLWHAVHERARVPENLVRRARRSGKRWNLLALSEDWCGDAVNTLPVVSRLAEKAGWEFRVLGRDANPDLMDTHLTNGRSRSIPVVIAYDERFREIGWWGPRPAELQAWVLDEGLAMSSPERYKVIRGWYARDRGATTAREVLDILE